MMRKSDGEERVGEGSVEGGEEEVGNNRKKIRTCVGVPVRVPVATGVPVGEGVPVLDGVPVVWAVRVPVMLCDELLELEADEEAELEPDEEGLEDEVGDLLRVGVPVALRERVRVTSGVAVWLEDPVFDAELLWLGALVRVALEDAVDEPEDVAVAEGDDDAEDVADAELVCEGLRVAERVRLLVAVVDLLGVRVDSEVPELEGVPVELAEDDEEAVPVAETDEEEDAVEDVVLVRLEVRVPDKDAEGK